MDWLLLSLGSALFLGAYEVTRKFALRENPVLPVLFCANFGGLVLVLVGLLGAATEPHLAHKWGLELHPLSAREHVSVFFKSALVSASWVLSYFGVKHLPISVAGPLRATSPILTILGALLLFHEAPTTLQWCGIAVILCGYLGFAWLGRSEGIAYLSDRWVGLLILGTILGAASGLYDKYLLQSMSFDPTTLQVWFSVYNVLVQAVLCRVLWWNKRASTEPMTLTFIAFAVGALLVLADQCYFRALSHPDALVSVVVLVRRASVVLSFAVGGFLLKEHLLRQKAVFLVVILVGLTLLFL